MVMVYRLLFVRLKAMKCKPSTIYFVSAAFAQLQRETSTVRLSEAMGQLFYLVHRTTVDPRWEAVKDKFGAGALQAATIQNFYTSAGLSSSSGRPTGGWENLLDRLTVLQLKDFNRELSDWKKEGDQEDLNSAFEEEMRRGNLRKIPNPMHFVAKNKGDFACSSLLFQLIVGPEIYKGKQKAEEDDKREEMLARAEKRSSIKNVLHVPGFISIMRQYGSRFDGWTAVTANPKRYAKDGRVARMARQPAATEPVQQVERAVDWADRFPTQLTETTNLVEAQNMVMKCHLLNGPRNGFNLAYVMWKLADTANLDAQDALRRLEKIRPEPPRKKIKLAEQNDPVSFAVEMGQLHVAAACSRAER